MFERLTKYMVFFLLPSIQVTNKVGNSVQLKFMRRNKTTCCFDFSLEREATHPIQDILTTVEDPVMIPVGRGYTYQFKEDIIIKLANNYSIK